MRLLRPVLAIVFATWAGAAAAGPSSAAEADLTTPESAVAAYIDGVAHGDFRAVLAATAADDMSRRLDFVAFVDRVQALTPAMPAPSSAPLLVEINRATFEAQTARQVQFLTYGLMTTGDILDGMTVQMDGAGAAKFAGAVRADRLAGLALVKVGIPLPGVMASVRYQADAAKIAHVYGADSSTERVALLSFEGLDFVVGFSLLRYGDRWIVMSQSSPLADTSSLGVPKRVTPQTFEDMLK